MSDLTDPQPSATEPATFWRTRIEESDAAIRMVIDRLNEGRGTTGTELMTALDALDELHALALRSIADEAPDSRPTGEPDLDTILLRYVNLPFGRAEAIECRDAILAALGERGDPTNPTWDYLKAATSRLNARPAEERGDPTLDDGAAAVRWLRHRPLASADDLLREALYGAYMDGRSDQAERIAPRGDEIVAKWSAITAERGDPTREPEKP